MNEDFDSETGEMLIPVSEAALQARLASEEKAPRSGNELMAALSAAVDQLPVWITKDHKGAHGKYATLKEILSVVRPVLHKNGIRIRQGANPSWTLDGGGVKGRLVPVYTDLIHKSGQTDRTVIEIPVTKLDAMAMGSALSYGRRYSLLAALGLTTDESDDDGKATKAMSITEEQDESQDLWILKHEIDEITDTAKLSAWGAKLASSRKADELSEREQTLLKLAYKTRLAEIAAAAAEPKAKK
jgi:hypothetical protein